MDAAIPLDMHESPSHAIAMNKAKDFVDQLGKVFDTAAADAANNGAAGTEGIAVVDFLFTMFGPTDHNFGYMASFQSEECPAIDDVFFGSAPEAFRSLVDRYPEYDKPYDQYMTRQEAFAAFVSLTAREVLVGYPVHNREAAKKHVIEKICSMFDGTNSAGIHFTLRYTETEDMGEKIDCTVPLGDFLLNNKYNF